MIGCGNFLECGRVCGETIPAHWDEYHGGGPEETVLCQRCERLAGIASGISEKRGLSFSAALEWAMCRGRFAKAGPSLLERLASRNYDPFAEVAA